MLAEVLLQRVVQDVRGRVGAADALPALGVDLGGDLVTDLQLPLRKWPRCSMKRIFLLRVDDFEAKAVAD